MGLTLNSLRRQGRSSRDEERVTKDRLPAKLARDGKPVYDRLVAIPPSLMSKSAWAGFGVEVRSGESHVAWRKGPHRTYALYSAAETVDPVPAVDRSSSTDAPTPPTEL